MGRTAAIKQPFADWLLNYSKSNEKPTPLNEAFSLLCKEFKTLSQKPIGERKDLSNKIKLLAEEERNRLQNGKYKSIHTFFNKLSQLFKGHGFIPRYEWAEKIASRLNTLPPTFEKDNSYIHSESFNLENIPWKTIGEKFEFRKEAIPAGGDPKRDWHLFCVQCRIKFLIQENKSFQKEEISRILSTGEIHLEDLHPMIMTKEELDYIQKHCEFTL